MTLYNLNYNTQLNEVLLRTHYYNNVAIHKKPKYFALFTHTLLFNMKGNKLTDFNGIDRIVT